MDVGVDVLVDGFVLDVLFVVGLDAVVVPIEYTKYICTHATDTITYS